MLFYLDSCDAEEIEELSELGLIAGVTTNPSLVAKSKSDFISLLKDICKIIKTSVSAEVISEHSDGMLKEAEKLLKVGEQITIKLPLTLEGLRACKILSSQKVKVNTTLCFSPAQALLAANAGATYVSPFMGRLEDNGQSGYQLIKDIHTIYKNYDYIKTKILVASVRNTNHIVDAAKIGADIATVPSKIFHSMIKHPLTDQGLAAFIKDWRDSGNKL
jgi:transaldolase